ncbi:hypothetical protein O3M35_008340 [Rhynocoris fuscipes]|uniref:Uncharacterized protein n=1 Tax=Rhynocoris fuscipes TaxID=488301 RepID=A0AAW1D5V6_9HEMI
MQLFAFGTTSRCADYIKISRHSTNSVANRSAHSCEFCIHYISRTAVCSLNFFLYSSLMLLNLDLISFGRHPINTGATSLEHITHFAF